MKHLFCFILSSLLISMTATAQSTIQEWSDAVTKFGKGLPQEKVFIHTDNQCYFLGDTIFYRAYLTRSDTRRPSGLSGVLYVELLNADGYLMERQQVQMKGGMGTGTLVLDTTYCRYAGYYEIRAYTRWQLNWGATTYKHTRWAEKWFFNHEMAQSYYRDYEKLYSRVLPVYDYPMEPGDYTRDMTERPLQRYFKNDNPHDDCSITLFPEGGNIIAGAPNRIAFEALNEDGRHMRGQLEIKTNDGNTVATATTVNRGRGVLTFTPQPGTKYRCTFTAGDNVLKVKMPDIEPAGVALNATITDATLDINATAVQIDESRTLGLAIMSCGIVDTTLDLSTQGMKHSLPLTQLPVGVLNLMVIDDEGRVYADRLVFNAGGTPTMPYNTVNIEGANTMTGAYKPITLKLHSGAQKRGIVSVAVMDAASTDDTYDNGSLLTEMLLTSEIRGFVEDPGYFFESGDAEHRTALDLLMMVQGWRRFNWHIMADPNQYGFELTHPYEPQTPIMTGIVNKYRVMDPSDIFREEAAAAAEEYMASNSENPWAEDSESSSTEGTTSTETTMSTDMAELNRQIDNTTVKYKQDAENASERFDKKYSSLKREVMVHAEFSQPGSAPLLGDMETEQGRFKIQSPLFDGECYFFLAASDTTKWGKKGHNWVQVNHEIVEKRDFPEFYVYLEQPYPRFAHPYSFYQTAPAEGRVRTTAATPGLYDDHQLAQVTVRVKRNGKRAFDKRYPAITVDALEAFNYAIDAGLCTGQFIGASRFCNDVARAYIGDMGQERQYIMQIRYDDKNTSANLSAGVINKYNDIAKLDKVKIYTDFAPRRMGDRRWRGSDQPTVTVDLMLMPHDGHRVTYRDRRIILQGFSICEDFYNPDYSRMALPQQPDYRRTLYWNPKLMLDDNGEATITLYRNSRPGEIVVTVNGFSTDGTPLSGEAR